MADASQQNAARAAPARGGRGRGRGRGAARGAAGGFRPPTGILDPETPSTLVEKWSKKLGRDLDSLSVKYTAAGCEVRLTGRPGTAFESLKEGTVADYRRLAEQANAQSPAQKLAALRRKYEDRVGAVPKDFPENWDDQVIEAWINGVPLEARRRLRMSQKQFRELHPNGVAV